MASILGLVGAASDEFHLLEVAGMRTNCAGARAARADRSWRAQLWAAYRQDMAIVVVELVDAQFERVVACGRLRERRLEVFRAVSMFRSASGRVT